MADGNGFTNKEILLDMRDEMRDGFKEMKDLFETGHADHERRLRSLEKKPTPYWTTSRVGALAGILAALSGVGYLIAYVVLG